MKVEPETKTGQMARKAPSIILLPVTYLRSKLKF
jgi:hypothetical protein